ncbi:hypothetical protein [Curtobacterium sp. BRD11]|uniref:hypothetical protein n=1 Tax=Curtobacterium sp. BRD11 TaxID=2962581 RepID=UPI0028819CF2|nr:hypothetical protein [Curtobacterium sp. BRD11]MDT0211240.1 hypothetical protein [Curtobacterium sp. BRD11]
MGDGITIDASALDLLAADLGEVASSAGPYVRDAMERTAIDVRDDWRKQATGIKRMRAYPSSIGYDFIAFQGFGATVLTCEIGPDKNRKQGALGNIVEFGSPTFAPRHQGDQALAAHSDEFEELLDQALQKAERALTFGGIVRSVASGRNTIL